MSAEAVDIKDLADLMRLAGLSLRWARSPAVLEAFPSLEVVVDGDLTGLRRAQLRGPCPRYRTLGSLRPCTWRLHRRELFSRRVLQKASRSAEAYRRSAG